MTAKRKLRVAVELGPKRKKVAAFALDWPGLERGGKVEGEAIETLVSYIPRYEAVAAHAGMEADYSKLGAANVMDRYEGPGSTDFWGISFGFSQLDWKRFSDADLERDLALLQSCWWYFDGVRRRVSAEMRKGPRGGGRDRDRIVSHVLGVEQDWAGKVGVAMPRDVAVVDARGVKRYRDKYLAAIRTAHREGTSAKKWPLRYLIRHSAFHTMDHAWEMEDKDLSEPRR
jgi:hypothetical protein